jgi:DNA-binding MarR family transcriptional regulator
MSELLSAAMEPALEKHGIKPATFDLLSTVHAAGDDATQAEIALRLGIKPPSLTEALRGLKHLVDQVPSPTDNRVKHLRLTNQGRAALSDTIKSVEAVSKSIVGGIQKSDLAVAVDVLKRANRELAKSVSKAK